MDGTCHAHSYKGLCSIHVNQSKGINMLHCFSIKAYLHVAELPNITKLKHQAKTKLQTIKL